MELKEVVSLYRRWMWLLLAGLVVGMGLGYLASRMQTPVYEASAKVLVAKNRQQGSNDVLSLSDQQLVVTYQQLLKTQPVLDQARSQLGIKINPDNIRADVLTNTQIIRITAADSNPRQASAIANALAKILIAQNEALQAGRYGAYEEGLNLQITQVQKQIADLQSQISLINEENVQEQLVQVNQQITSLQDNIAALQKSIAETPVYSLSERADQAEKQAQLNQLRSLLSMYQQIQTNLTYIGKPVEVGNAPNNPRVDALQSTLNLYQQLYLNLLNNLEAVKLASFQNTPMVSQIDSAVPPKQPVRPLVFLYTALAAIVGLLLSAAVVLLIDYFEDSFSSRQKVRELLQAPVIGQISEIGPAKGGWFRRPVPPEQAAALQENEFGSLRMNLFRLLARKPQRTVLITSTSPGEGKTTISANLARSFARAGKRVILVDADLDHPKIDEEFGLERHLGMTDILSGDVDWQEASCTQDNVVVITAGSANGNANGILESAKMTEFLEQLQRKADIVIVDGPPLFTFSAQILASKLGGVVLVIRQGATKMSIAHSVRDQVELMEIHLLGVVMNRVPHTASYHYGGYYMGGVVEEKSKEQHKEAAVV